jgi:hypothetical protein
VSGRPDGGAGFIGSCFLPYVSLGGPRSMSLYRLVVHSFVLGEGTVVEPIGRFLYLFGGAGIVACIGLAGIRHRRHASRWTPFALAAAAAGLVRDVDRRPSQPIWVPRELQSGLLVRVRQPRCGHRRHDRHLGICEARYARAGLGRTANPRRGSTRLDRRPAVRRGQSVCPL